MDTAFTLVQHSQRGKNCATRLFYRLKGFASTWRDNITTYTAILYCFSNQFFVYFGVKVNNLFMSITK